MLKTDWQPAIENRISVRGLYESYSAMLFGYILEVVQDRALAEECMTQLFHDISQHFDENEWQGGNNWCTIRRLAKDKLNVFKDRYSDCEPLTNLMSREFSNKKGPIQLTSAQKEIFCAIYYHRKSVSQVSNELNITEELTRKTLKQAFDIMRDGGKN